jgi:hypothetical protein
VLVDKADFTRVRKTLQTEIPIWYENQVPSDAKPNPDRYPGDPEVAPLPTDVYPGGEDSYFSASVNTAMSYDTLTSDITNDFSQNTTDQATTTAEGQDTTYADKVKGIPTTQKSTPLETIDQPISVQPTIEASLISDLASSRAELEALKTKMSRLELAKAKESQELAQKVEQQKQAMELQAAAQKFEMEKQAEEQRRAFQQQLDDQRRELESKSFQQKRELEATLKAQINKAIQDYFVTAPNPTAQHPIPPDFYKMFENQERQIQLLTTMMTNKMSEQNCAPQVKTPTLKRRTDVVDLTEDPHGSQDLSAEEEPKPKDICKHIDVKIMPQKVPRAKSEQTQVDLPVSPSRYMSGGSFASPERASPQYWPWTPESVETIYPDHPNHPLHPEGDESSDNDHEVDVSMTSPRFSPYHASQALAPVADNYSKLVAVNLPIISRSVRRVKKRSARGIQSLRTYFTSVPSDE